MSHGGSSGGPKVGCLGRGDAKGDRRPGVVMGVEPAALEEGEKILDVQVGWTHVGVVVGKEEEEVGE